MKKTIFLLLFLTTFTAKADVDPAWSGICGSMSKMQSLAAQWNIWPATTPLPPYVGITLGMVQQNNVLLEICDLVQALEKADALFALDKTKSVLNTMTNNKWMERLGFDEDQFEFVRDSLVSPDADTNRGKWMEARAHKQLDEYSKRMQIYYNENSNTDSVSDRERADEDRRKLAQSAKNVAVLRETIKCPDATDKPNYTKIYTNDILPQEKIQENAEKDIDYFYDQLKQLGIKLAVSERDLDKYLADLSRIKSSGAYMTRSVGKTTASTQSISSSKGKKVIKKVPITRKFYEYSAKETDTLYTNFKTDYDQAFKKYVRYLYLTNTTQFGVFDGADKRVEQSFRQLSFECSERRLMKDFDTNQQNYDSIFEQKRVDCEQGFKTNQSDSESLFSKYLTELRSALFANRQAHAKIWTIESQYLEIHRVPKDDDKESVVAQNETSCESNFTQKEVEALKLKMKNEENNLRAQSAQSVKKKTVRKELANKKEKEDLHAYIKEKEFEESTNKFQEDASNQPMPLTPIKSKIETKK